MIELIDKKNNLDFDTPPVAIKIDNTLTKADEAAEAKVVGEALSVKADTADVENKIDNLISPFEDDMTQPIGRNADGKLVTKAGVTEEYVDAQDAKILTQSKDYTDNKTTEALVTAKFYTDKEVLKKADKTELPNKVSQLTNDRHYIPDNDAVFIEWARFGTSKEIIRTKTPEGVNYKFKRLLLAVDYADVIPDASGQTNAYLVFYVKGNKNTELGVFIDVPHTFTAVGFIIDVNTNNNILNPCGILEDVDDTQNSYCYGQYTEEGIKKLKKDEYISEFKLYWTDYNDNSVPSFSVGVYGVPVDEEVQQ